MTTLSDKIKGNLKFILELEEDDSVHANHGSLLTQSEYVQVDNDLEIEYAMYFTFAELLGRSILVDLNYTSYDELINNIDKCIDNIYNNKQLNLMIENNQNFYEIMNHIEDLFDNLKDKVFYYSPFYNIIRTILVFKSKIYGILKDNNENVKKIMKITHSLNQHLTYGINVNSDDNSDDNSGDNSDDNRDDNSDDNEGDNSDDNDGNEGDNSDDNDGNEEGTSIFTIMNFLFPKKFE